MIHLLHAFVLGDHILPFFIGGLFGIGGDSNSQQTNTQLTLETAGASSPVKTLTGSNDLAGGAVQLSGASDLNTGTTVGGSQVITNNGLTGSDVAALVANITGSNGGVTTQPVGYLSGSVANPNAILTGGGLGLGTASATALSSWWNNLGSFKWVLLAGIAAFGGWFFLRRKT